MTKKQTFESALQVLEAIVKEMESGSLCLEEAVRKYEIGMKQSRFCSEYLDRIEQKITLLTRDKDGQPKEELLDDDES